MSASLSRRNFLNITAAASLAALVGKEPGLLRAAGAAKIEPKADTLILLWMAGGMAHTETFDPKRYTPFEKGVESKRVLSTFPQIDSAVDSIKLSQGLERIASVMDRGTLIRSHTLTDMGRVLHARHQFHWHTGYTPPQSVAVPHLGSVIARTLGPRNPDLPAFVDIGQRIEGSGDNDSLRAFHTSGFLGSEHGPFLIPHPNDAASAVQPPAHMNALRFRRRHENYRGLLADSPVLQAGSDFQQQSLLRAVENAHRLLQSPAAKAFDLSLEPAKSAQAYGTGRFGLGCLLARRLTEAGARFIEVTTEYIPFRHWDTHEHGHERTIGMKQEIDAPVAQLVLDLEERGLLNRTLIVLASEFGRDMMTEGLPGKLVKECGSIQQPDIMTEPKHYGMHRHFTAATSVLLFGGGVKKGFLYGQTASERPLVVVRNPVPVEDLHATIYHAMGIPPDLAYEVEKRPFYVTKDGKGKPVLDIFT
jgi:uncharacterized protein (DUF1501 family)